MNAGKRPSRPRLSAASGILLAALLALALAGGRAGSQTPPAAPTIDSVTAAATSLTVAWTAPAGVTGITAYDVRYIATDDDETADANWTVVDSAWTSGTLEYAITALEKGTGYDVQVRAVTTIDGQWSATTAATTTVTVPDTATLDAVTAGEGALGVAWSEPADTGGAEISSYDLRYIRSDATDKGDANWDSLSGAWQADDPTPTSALTRIITGLDADTQYDVQVRASNSAGGGGWSATVTGTPVADHGSAIVPTDLALGTLTSGSITPGDKDWFRFVVAETTELVLFTRGSLDTFGRLWKGAEQLIVSDDGYVGENPENFAIGARLGPGTYLLLVEGYQWEIGDYLLQTVTLPETTGRADAAPIEAGVYANQITGAVGDRDWFSFTLTEESAVLVSGIGQGAIVGKLFDSGGGSVPGFSSISLPGHDFMLAGTLAAGTWYLEVRGISGTGLYHVRLDEVSEPGDTRADAAALALEGYAGGRIDAADDVDYFRIDFSGRTETVYVRIATYGAGANLSGELLDSDGDPLPGPLDILFNGGPTGFWIWDGLEPGVYYLKVTRTGGAATGSFAVNMVEDRRYAAFVERCEGISSSYSDPLFGCQWNLVNSGQLGGVSVSGEDINVAGAWSTTMGAGVTVAVVDDGVQLAHEDLVDNADPAGSHDYGSRGLHVRHRWHGTAVAGVVAARDNTLGVRGVAPRATIRGLNYILYPTDVNRAHAATHGMDTVAVNTNSWGHGTGFRTPSAVWRMAIERGVTEGYGGKGVFYVWSAGNSAVAGDNVNYDGIPNFHAVTAVCAVNYRGTRSYYSEPGAVLWVCGPSNGLGGWITTTTEFRYTGSFSGTSAAAPAVAGVAALVRAANTDLTWRDVKLILAESARKNDASNEGWSEAGPRYAGSGSYEFNHEYGFGMVDATAAVNLATSWTLLPPRREQESSTATVQQTIPDPNPVDESVTPVSSSVTVAPYVGFIEFVEINIDITHADLRNLSMTLTSPSGTVSRLAERVPEVFYPHAPFYRAPLRGWTRFGSARHLGEDSAGTWTLTVTDHSIQGRGGTLRGWNLTIYGHGGPPARPLLDSIEPSSGALTILWSEPPALDGDPPVTSYDLRYIRSNATDKGDEHWTLVTGAWSSGALSYAVGGLPGGVSYDVQVRGVNRQGHGAWSEMLRATSGATPPSSPVISAVVPGNRFLTVSWDAPAESGGRPITAYDVQHRQGSGPWTVIDGATSARRYTIRELANDAYHDVEVRAVNAVGESQWGESGSGKPRAVNSVPAFPAGETGARSVDENTPAGTDFGAPVAARDADDDAITYTISGAGARFFDVDPGTGQLRTKEPLDHEARPSHALTVTATDVANARATQRVTVTVADVNEPPIISGPDSLEYAEEGTTPLATYRVRDPEDDDVTFSVEGDGLNVMSITDGILRFVTPPDYENPVDADGDNTYEVTVVADDGLNRATHDVTITVTNVNDAPVIDGDQAHTLLESYERGPFVSLFTVTDQDDPYSAVSLAGPDRDAFKLEIYTLANTDVNLFLGFRPDYEAPRDANRDNVYQVTVQASDASSTVSLPVTVTVENVDEPGTVTLSTVQPQVGVRITATLHEPDRASGLSWQWVANGAPISGATSSGYTPLADDVGSLLTATVSYTDGTGVAQAARKTADAVVRAAPATNAAPAFPAEETAAREVRENDTTLTGLGRPVAATDPDSDPLTYSIDRAAAAFFDIDQGTGLLTPRDLLDREHRSSHRVTVTATDPSNARASITVTINVQNDPEAPLLTGPRVIFYPDGGTHAVATYRAFDPENERVVWELTGDDRMEFSLEGGVLRFAHGPPDFDNPGANGGDNEYHITIRALDLDYTASDPMNVVVIVVDGAVRAPGSPGGGGGGGGFAGGGGGFAGGGGGPSGPAPSEVEFEWNVTRDIEALDAGNSIPTGAWSSDGVLWITNNAAGAGDAVYAYDLATGERVAAREFSLHERNGAPRGIWADGGTAWVADSGRDRLFAYDLASGRHSPERDIALDSRNADARGLWGDEGVVLVLDRRRALFAYDLAGGALLGEYALDEANADPRDAWSDGVTLWVSDHGAKRLFAYRLPEPPAEGDAPPEEPPALERVRGEEFEEPGRVGNNSPRGIWSDGEVMYVVDEADGKVYTYNMPDALDARLASLDLSGVELGTFSPAVTSYRADALDAGTTTVTATAAQRRTTVTIDPPDADGDPANGHQVDLAGVDEITVTVTSADRSRTRVYRVRLRETAEEPPAPPGSCLLGAVAEGFSLVVHEGGALENLDACAAGRSVVALYVLHEGRYLAYIPGAPEFANRDFAELFADGVPALTPLVAASAGPPSDDPVGGVRAPDDWPGCLGGRIGAGFSLVLYAGGTVEELAACARGRDVQALYALHEGEWVSYILGAPDSVNRSFTELYAAGLPPLTPLVVRSGGPPADGPDGDGGGN